MLLAVPSDGPCSLCPAHVAASAAVQMDTVTPAPLQLKAAGDAAVMEKLLAAAAATAAEVTSVKITAMSLFIVLSFCRFLIQLFFIISALLD